MSADVRDNPERGQSIVLLALMFPVLLGAIALVLDIGNAYVARRDLQNAADLGSLAVAQYLGKSASPTDAQVTNIITDFVTDNAPLANTVWSAVYIKGDGTSTGTSVGNSSHTIPSGAAGVLITPKVQTHNFFESVLGAKFIQVAASGGAVGAINSPNGGAAIGGSSAPAIVALDAGSHIWPHTIIADDTGTFSVKSASSGSQGSIIDDNCYGSWDSTGTTCTDNGTFTDVLDAKEGGTVSIAGALITASNSPFDGHFDPSGGGSVGSTQATGNYGGTLTTINYGSLSTGQAYYPDPLSNLTEPTTTSSECSGASNVTSYTQTSFSAGTYSPAVYSGKSGGPAIFKGAVTLDDCGNSTPGVYVFPNGVIFEGQVTGADIMLYSSGSFSAKKACTDTKQANNGGTVLNEPYIGSSSGVNAYGFIFTGTSSVTLSAPNTGAYTNLALFQSRSVAGHMGFKVCPGDDGAIAITGTVYAHNKNDIPNGSSNTVDVSNATPDTCNGGSGWCTAGNASALVFGTDDGDEDGNGTSSCGSKKSCTWPNKGGGTLTIDGCAIVDVFYTTGNANVTITYDTAHVPLLGAKLIH